MTWSVRHGTITQISGFLIAPSFGTCPELVRLSAVSFDFDEYHFFVDLDWPRTFSESELLEMYEQMPSAASASHPAMSELSRLLGRRR